MVVVDLVGQAVRYMFPVEERRKMMRWSFIATLVYWKMIGVV